MSDVDSVLAEVSRFADDPPLAPPPIEHLAQRAEQRRRRRRVGSVAVACAIVLTVGLALEPSFLGDDGQVVRTADAPEAVPTTSTTVATTTSVTSGDGGLVVEPSTGLTDGQVVVVSGSFEPSPIQGVAICDAEGVTRPDPTSWCDINVPWSKHETSIELTVVRRIHTGHGYVDCSERPGRCVVGVRTSDGSSLTAALTFAAGLEPLPTPHIAVDSWAVDDGAGVEVVLTGFEPSAGRLDRDARIHLVQCRGSSSDAAVAGDWAWDRCDAVRSAAADPDSSGEARLTFTAHAEIFTYGGWVPCDPCVLVASASWQPAAAVDIHVASSGPQARPAVRIVPEGPYEAGQRVRLEGAGFGAGTGVDVGWCAFRTEDPASEVQGDPNFGHAPCRYPWEGFDVVADADGTFVVEDYPLPDGDIGGFACHDPAVRCGLAWHPGEGMPPVFVTLLDR